MIIDHIEKIRQKPEHIRRRILLGSTVGITAIIALIWLSVSYISFSHQDTTRAAVDSPFYSIESNFAAVGTAFSQEKTVLEQTFSGK